MIEQQQMTPSRLRTRRRWMALCGASTLALGTTFATLAWDDAKPAGPVGLQGILPMDVPAALNEDAYAALEGNWKDWAEKTAAEINKLYSDASLDLSGQRHQLDILKVKLKTMETSLKSSQYQGIHEILASLHAPLSRRVMVAEAVLDTLGVDPKQAAASRVDSARQTVQTSLGSLEAELNGVKNGPAWLSYVRSAELRKTLSDKSTDPNALNLLESVTRKLTTTDSTSPEIRKFLEGRNQSALRESLVDYGAALKASNQTVNADQLRASLVALVAAIEKFEESQSTVDGIELRKAFSAVRAVAPDGGQRLASAMSTNYFNYNLRVLASEGFLTRVVSQDQTNAGPVRDCILGANVSGNQTTNARVSIDLKPSNNGVKFDITLHGVVNSNTVGVTEEASVYTQGYHQFWARKPVMYDGDQFTTGVADIQVAPNNMTTGVSTKYSNIPLLGGIADSIAEGEVEERRGQAQAIAADRVRTRVLPEFNKEVNDKFGEMQKDLDTGLNARLKKQNLWPTARSFRSTESELRASLRLMGDQELGGSDGPYAHVPQNGFVVAIHESLLNNAMARLNIAGRTLKEEELADEIEKSFSDLLGRPFNASKKIEDAAEAKKDPATFIFPDRDPIQFRMDNGQLILIIRAGLKQTGEEDIPTQVISVPLTFRVEGSNLVVESGEVGVSPVETPKNTALQITRAGIVRTKVKNALPPRKFDRFATIDKNVQKPVNVGVTSIKPAGGWMVIAFQ